MEYPAHLERDDNGTLLVSFPDFPEAHTFGVTEAEALRHASDALVTVIEAYMQDGRDVPVPSVVHTSHRVTLPATAAANLAQYRRRR